MKKILDITSDQVCCYRMNYTSPPNSYVEALAFNVTVFDGKAFGEVKAKWVHQGGAWWTYRLGVLERIGRDTTALSPWKHRGKAIGVMVSRRQEEASPEIKHVGSLMLDIQLPELWEINFYYLGHSDYDIYYARPND